MGYLVVMIIFLFYFRYVVIHRLLASSTMKVIGAGLSKTGTKSLAKALRILGYTVYDRLEHAKFHFNEWVDLQCEGKMPDFVEMYRGVDVVISLPAAFWFQEISEAFPDAKVILTLRDSEDVWAQSWVKHIKYTTSYGGYRYVNRIAISWLLRIFTAHSVHRLLQSFLYPTLTAEFGSLNPKSTVVFKKKYREHNKRVQAVIPKEKLLIYNVNQGWKPLCEFLGCDVPDQEFPKENVALSFLKPLVSARIQKLKGNMFFSLAIFSLLLSVLSMLYLVFNY